MTSSVWYLAISKAVVGKYERRKRFQASSQVARSVIVRFDSLRMFALSDLLQQWGCIYGEEQLFKFHILTSAYFPAELRGHWWSTRD